MEGADGSSIGEALTVLADLKKDGLVRHIGLSNVDARQVVEAQRMTPVVCAQNHDNLMHRTNDALIDSPAAFSACE